MNNLNEKNIPARWKAMAEMLINDPERFAKLNPEYQKLLKSIIDGTKAVGEEVVKQVEKIVKDNTSMVKETNKKQVKEKKSEIEEKVENDTKEITKTETE